MKKGFTLIEVMAAIIILSSIALISYPVLTNVLKNNKDIENNTFQESAILGAKTYFNLHKENYNLNELTEISVDVKDLIEEGLIDKPDQEYNDDDRITCQIESSKISSCEYKQKEE